jgi:hypothetical protein
MRAGRPLADHQLCRANNWPADRGYSALRLLLLSGDSPRPGSGRRPPLSGTRPTGGWDVPLTTGMADTVPMLATEASAQGGMVAVGRAARRAERSSLVESVLGESQASAGLDLLELVEYAWHDCSGEITPPDDVILNILVCSRGKLSVMVHAAKLAIDDWRDLQLWAEQVQSEAE